MRLGDVARVEDGVEQASRTAELNGKPTILLYIRHPRAGAEFALISGPDTGAGTNRAIGTVIFGGQTLSLLLTLLATPVVYSLLDDAQSWVAKWREREVEPQREEVLSGRAPR